MANWLTNGAPKDSTTRTCSSCHITLTVNIYDGRVTYQYCPYCGAKMVNPNIDNDMTSKELHVKRIIPARDEVSRLERKYKELFRKEKAEEAGVKVANCGNCAYSCVLEIDDHNGCLGGKCTCCNDWCYKWMPETPVSAWLRQNKHYDDFLIYKLTDLFGDDFLAGDDAELVKRGLEWLKEVEEKKRTN